MKYIRHENTQECSNCETGKNILLLSNRGDTVKGISLPDDNKSMTSDSKDPNQALQEAAAKSAKALGWVC